MDPRTAQALAGQMLPLLPINGIGPGGGSGADLLRVFAQLLGAATTDVPPEVRALLAREGLGAATPQSTTATQPVEAPQDAAAAPQPTSASDALAAWEARLARDARVTEKVLDRVIGPAGGEATSAGPATTLQQTIYLIGAAGAATGGRFVVRNTTDRERTLTFIARTDADIPAALRGALPIRFEPEQATLGPGEQVTVRIRVDCSAASSDLHFEFPVDVVDEEQVLLRVWVDVELTGP